MVPGTDNTEFEMRTSTNGGSSYDATPGDYHWGYTVAQASGASADAGSTGNSFISLGSSIGNTSGRSWNGEVTIYNPTGSSVNKVVKVDSIYTTSAGTVRRLVGGGARVVTADIDAIRFLMSSGNIASGTFALYGIR